MINYSIDTNARYWHYFILLLIAFIISYFVVDWFSEIENRYADNEIIVYLSKVSSPGFLAVFTMILFPIHVRYTWRYLPEFLRCPDISGEWVGYIISRTGYSAADNETNGNVTNEELLPVTLSIEQTFSRISFEFNSIKHSAEETPNPTYANMSGMTKIETSNTRVVYTWTRNKLAGRTELYLSSKGKPRQLWGDYVSNHPRTGELKLTEVKDPENHFCGPIQELRSRSGRKYLAVLIDEGSLSKQLGKLRKILKEDFSEFAQRRHLRDNSSYHITIIDPEEYNPKVHSYLKGRSFWFHLGELGVVEDKGAKSFFAICTSEVIQKTRFRTH